MRRVGFLAATLFLAAGVTAAAAPPSSETAPSPPFTADNVLSDLDRTLAWYQQARAAMRSINAGTETVFGREDQQTVLSTLQRAFEAAHAEAAWLARTNGASVRPGSGTKAADERASVEADIARDQQELERLRARARRAPARSRAALDRAAAAATNQLDLDKLRLDFLTRLHQLDPSLGSADDDLEHRIQALQDGVPELHSNQTASDGLALPTPGSGSGNAVQIRRWLALERSRSSLDDQAATTSVLIRRVDRELHDSSASARPILARLRELSKDPSPAGTSLEEGQQAFHQLLERGRLLGDVILPLRAESVLLHRYAVVLADAQRVIHRASVQALQSMGIELASVALSVAGILLGGVVWRVGVSRHVADAYRRRLLMGARNVVIVGAVVLVIVFHFTTELAALVTALGFAAAGIAFALQNVILAIAGYFSMVAPHGIRTGDRVSLQGPFGYVQGEVEEIGLLRIKLRELAGEPAVPTGRIVIFPNSVVFTGSFFKQSEGPSALP